MFILFYTNDGVGHTPKFKTKEAMLEELNNSSAVLGEKFKAVWCGKVEDILYIETVRTPTVYTISEFPF